MKKKFRFIFNNQPIETVYNYMPVRYLFAAALTVFEVTAMVGIVIACCRYIPYFYVLSWMTEVACIIRIIASDDNPDYKVPWLVIVLVLPVAGFMLYFIFYSRRLKKKYVRRTQEIKDGAYHLDDQARMAQLRAESPCRFVNHFGHDRKKELL